MQIGVDITAEAVIRAGRKVLAAYKQADDPLSKPLQQWGGLSDGPAKPSGVSANKQLPGCQLYHGDIATASAAQPGRLPCISAEAVVSSKPPFVKELPCDVLRFTHDVLRFPCEPDMDLDLVRMCFFLVLLLIRTASSSVVQRCCWKHCRAE